MKEPPETIADRYLGTCTVNKKDKLGERAIGRFNKFSIFD